VGRVHTYTATVEPARTSRLAPLARGLDVVIGTLLLLVALPAIAMIALAVRRSSHGPVFHRDNAFDRHGRPVQLLTFRTGLDGSGTLTHERLRAVVGGHHTDALTRVGRVLRATRADRLPRLFNVVAGHSSLLSS
jgi:putative colanic acid biosynthesis UDP-glucose lipid carrier transferase